MWDTTLDERPGIFIRGKPIFLSEVCYIRTMTARIQLKKIYLVMSINELDAKMN
jgi:hypothetical protein